MGGYTYIGNCKSSLQRAFWTDRRSAENPRISLCLLSLECLNSEKYIGAVGLHNVDSLIQIHHINLFCEGNKNNLKDCPRESQ